MSGSSQPASLPSLSSGDPQAVSSCLETIQRFARAEGFSTHLATPVAYACRSSSCATSHIECLFLVSDVSPTAIPFLVPLSPELRIFCFGFRDPRFYPFLLSWVIGPCWLLFSGFTFRISHQLRFLETSLGRSRWRRQLEPFDLLPGT